MFALSSVFSRSRISRLNYAIFACSSFVPVEASGVFCGLGTSLSLYCRPCLFSHVSVLRPGGNVSSLTSQREVESVWDCWLAKFSLCLAEGMVCNTLVLCGEPLRPRWSFLPTSSLGCVLALHSHFRSNSYKCPGKKGPRRAERSRPLVVTAGTALIDPLRPETTDRGAGLGGGQRLGTAWVLASSPIKHTEVIAKTLQVSYENN